MDRIPAPAGLRLLGFATAVVGAACTGAAVLLGERGLAVAVGLRVLGLGLLAMGGATLRSPAELAGPNGVGPELVRGGVLVVVGGVLAAVPGVVVATVG